MEKYENFKYIIPYIVVIILFVVGLVFVFTKIHFKAQKKIFIAQIKQNKLEIDHQKELLNSIIQVQEDERKRMGRLIHDDIGNRIHILSICVQQIEMNECRSKDILLKQLPLLSDATRSLAHDMYPVEIEYLGLVDFLKEIQISIFQKIDFQIHTSKKIKIKDLQIQLQIFRIIQEFLNNVIKYAHASVVTLCLRQTHTYLSIALHDNGIGFNVSEVKKGMGMNNIDFRVKALFGNHKWKSEPNKGTSLIIKIKNKDGR